MKQIYQITQEKQAW